ncbi:MAG: N-methyl-L-tryptophan oxidase [bacterium]
MTPPPAAFGALVIGAGVHGLATAWQLARRGVPRVGLVERFRLHHDRGSSHGEGRITRTTYGEARWVRLMRVAHAEDWPGLERACGRTLLHRTDGVFFGPPAGDLDHYADAVATAGAPGVERLTPAEARRRFPAFAFPDAHAVLHDTTGGVLAAADTLRALDRLCRIEGVHVLEETRVRAIEAEHDPVVVDTDRGRLLAERVVVTAGAWVGELVPSLRTRVAVKRQHVGYFALGGEPADARPGRFPVWVRLGPPDEGVHYGLPEFGRPGIKAAWHATAGGDDDPETHPGPDPGAIERVRAFLVGQLAAPLGPTLHRETCLYTNTPDERFVVGPLPSAPRVVVGSACSGHGFKFGPLMGRILAGLAMDGTSGVPEFESEREVLAPPAP